MDKFFRIHVRHIKLFYDVYLPRLITKSTFKIIFLGGYVLRIVFYKLLDEGPDVARGKKNFIQKNLRTKKNFENKKIDCLA